MQALPYLLFEMLKISHSHVRGGVRLGGIICIFCGPIAPQYIYIYIYVKH